MVHWTMNLRDRHREWLDDVSHAKLRELLLHMATMYGISVSVYCAMPDHTHLLWLGLRLNSDQLNACEFFRRHVNDMLATRYQARLQKQAYDHVLREKERERGPFEKIAFYILENPVRAGLVATAQNWPCSGCIVAGHPSWSVFHENYWETFWNWYAENRKKATS